LSWSLAINQTVKLNDKQLNRSEGNILYRTNAESDTIGYLL